MVKIKKEANEIDDLNINLDILVRRIELLEADKSVLQGIISKNEDVKSGFRTIVSSQKRTIDYLEDAILGLEGW